MGICAPFPAMLKACAPYLSLKQALGNESVLGDTIGIDMSITMTSAVKSDRGAEEFDQDPPYPDHHVAVTVLTLLRKLNKIRFCVLSVFDGISRSLEEQRNNEIETNAASGSAKTKTVVAPSSSLPPLVTTMATMMTMMLQLPLFPIMVTPRLQQGQPA